MRPSLHLREVDAVHQNLHLGRPRREAFDSLEHLQSVTDARLDDRAARLRCPITGTSVAAAWDEERRLLTALPE